MKYQHKVVERGSEKERDGERANTKAYPVVRLVRSKSNQQPVKKLSVRSL